MAYLQGKKTTISEKKLQALRIQLYGKETFFKDKSSGYTPVKTIEVNYLKRDLLKILLLAILAIGAQILLASSF